MLAQEAKAAAHTLLRGVGPHDSVPPPPRSEGGTRPRPSAEEALRGALAHLDETVTALSSLQGQPSRGRRGRIDLATLVWEVAPEARVQIDVGSGLAVLGEEGELRRMLHVLMALGGDPLGHGEVQVVVRREGALVRTSVELGPDRTRGFEAEAKWLSHMTTRYGGSLALEGNAMTLLLPADDEVREVEALRRELAEAQAQGEAFARELAQVMSTTRSEPPPSLHPSSVPSLDGLGALVAASRAIVSDARSILAAIGRDLAPVRALRDPTTSAELARAVEAASSVARHVAAASELVGDVGRIARCPLGELPSHGNLGDLLRDVITAERSRAARRELTIELGAIDVDDDVFPRAMCSLLLELALSYAIAVAPRGGRVRASLQGSATTLTATLDIPGAELAPDARSSVKSRNIQTLAQASPSGLALVGALGIAAHLHAPFRVVEAPGGGIRLWLALPRTLPAVATDSASGRPGPA
jgi:two-component system OmpR family sensor kinase